MGLRYLALYLYMSTNLKAMPGCNEPPFFSFCCTARLVEEVWEFINVRSSKKFWKLLASPPNRWEAPYGICTFDCHALLVQIYIISLGGFYTFMCLFFCHFFFSGKFMAGGLCKSRMNSETLEIICVRIKTLKLDFNKSTCFYSGWEFFMFGFVFLLRRMDKLSKKGKTQVNGVYH
jgi:hypothetical protein